MGSTRSSTWPNTTFCDSENIEAKPISVTNRICSGRRIVKRAIFSQNPVSLGVRSRLITRSALTLSPRRLSIAGSAKAAPSTAKKTTVKPASAKDCRKYCGKNDIESITTATVRPENSTVLPADATVFTAASGTELPSARSSRNRFTTSRL